MVLCREGLAKEGREPRQLLEGGLAKGRTLRRGVQPPWRTMGRVKSVISRIYNVSLLLNDIIKT